MLLAFYFFLMVSLPLLLGAVVTFNGLPHGRFCPVCADETLRLLALRATLASRLVPDEEIHRRWCPRCDWHGLARITTLRPGLDRDDHVLRPDGVDIRSISMDGESWRVVLQCWADEGQWQGRLLFIDRAGHSWPEPSPVFHGPSPLAVLSQALALPDPALAGRIRRAVR